MLSFNDTSEKTERGGVAAATYHSIIATGQVVDLVLATITKSPWQYWSVLLAVRWTDICLSSNFMSQQRSHTRSSYLGKAANTKRQLAASLTSDKAEDAPILPTILDNISTVIGFFRLHGFASLR